MFHSYVVFYVFLNIQYSLKHIKSQDIIDFGTFIFRFKYKVWLAT